MDEQMVNNTMQAPQAQPVPAEPVQPVVEAQPIPVVEAQPIPVVEAQPVQVVEPVAAVPVPVAPAQVVPVPVAPAQVAPVPVAPAQVVPVPVAEPVPVEPAPRFCSGCGTEIPAGMNFCPKCGKPLAAPAKKAPALKMPLLIGIGAAILAIITALVIFLAIPKEIPAADIVVDPVSVELKEEEVATISCTVYPQDATDKTVIWTSSDEKIATVNELGTITAVGKGECVITAQCGEASKTIPVTVKTKIDFKALYESLDSDVKYGWEVGSDGSFLSADDNVYNLDDYSNNNIWESIKKMNETLGLPASLTEDMGQTTWSMGRQNQKFPSQGLEVTWTYHPDKGMEVTYKLLVE